MTAAANPALIQDVSDAGLSAAHPPVELDGHAVAPAIADEKNVLVMPVVPVACWRVEDARFDFDSSFVLPQMKQEVQFLIGARDRLTIATEDSRGTPRRIAPPISLFGHADPVGNDDYNKRLSGRRAKAIYALLTKNVALWETLYSSAHGLDDWGLRAIQTMLAEVGAGTPAVTGKQDEATTEATRSFQQANGLTADGIAGPKTRAVLFRAYMDALCGAGFKLDPVSDFLARGTDAQGKGDYQGCGEFNPVLLFSQQQEQGFAAESDHTTRNAQNAPNRRVLVLLFEPGTVVTPSLWPCPRADDGGAACLKRFWSDGERRRGTRLPDAQRAWEKTADTFGCRFYHRLVRDSPCERPLKAGSTRWDLVPVTPDSPDHADEAPPPGADETLTPSQATLLSTDEELLL